MLCHDSDEALSDAVELLEHSLVLDPEHDGAEIALATALRERGDVATAIEHVDRVLKRGSGQAQALMLHALLCLEVGRLEDAKRDMERALRIAPHAGLIALDGAHVHRALGDLSAADALEDRSRLLLGATFEAVKRALGRG